MNLSLLITNVYLQIPVLSHLRLEETKLDCQEFDCWENDDVIVEHHSSQQYAEPDELKVIEILPADEHADGPDDESPHAVQDHPRGGRQFLRDGDARKVEKRDGGDGP